MRALALFLTLHNDPLPEGVIMLPINRKARSIILSCGAKLAGIRFHPAIGYGVLGQHYEKPTLLLPEQDQAYKLYQVYSELELQENSDAQIDILYRWVDESLDFNTVIPQSLVKTLKRIEQEEVLTGLSEFSELSQRQTERIFKHWLQMTPKYYQRIIRVKKALCFLKRHKRANLADVAQQFGFSDQAHMTREFRFIASVTPAKCRKSLGFNA